MTLHCTIACTQQFCTGEASGQCQHMPLLLACNRVFAMTEDTTCLMVLHNVACSTFVKHANSKRTVAGFDHVCSMQPDIHDCLSPAKTEAHLLLMRFSRSTRCPSKLETYCTFHGQVSCKSANSV